MKNSILYPIALAMILLGVSCGKDNAERPEPEPPKPSDPNPQYEAFWASPYLYTGLPIIVQLGYIKADYSRSFIERYFPADQMKIEYRLVKTNQTGGAFFPVGSAGVSRDEFVSTSLICVEFIGGQTWEARPVDLLEEVKESHSYFTRYARMEEDAEFSALAEHFGDTLYNRELYINSFMVTLADEFTSVEIVSDRAFDATHPAGASLGDLVAFMAGSPYRFIQGGYRDAELTNRDMKDFLTSHIGDAGTQILPINKRLDELHPDDLKMIGQQVYLRFITPPPAGKHNFTITFRSAQKVLSQTIEVNIQ